MHGQSSQSRQQRGVTYSHGMCTVCAYACMCACEYMACTCICTCTCIRMAVPVDRSCACVSFVRGRACFRRQWCSWLAQSSLLLPYVMYGMVWLNHGGCVRVREFQQRRWDEGWRRRQARGVGLDPSGEGGECSVKRLSKWRGDC